MLSFIGLRKEDAINLANDNGYEISFIPYISLRGVEDSDASIVIRQKLLDCNQIELVISEFKTIL